MGQDVNIVTLGGRLTKDAEMQYSAQGKPFMKIGLATTVGFGENKKTVFTNWVMFGDRVEKLVEHLKKGTGVVLTGNFDELQAYTRKTDGQPGASANMVVRDFWFSGDRGRGDEGG